MIYGIVGVVILACLVIAGFKLCHYLGEKPQKIPGMANPFRDERMKREDRSI